MGVPFGSLPGRSHTVLEAAASMSILLKWSRILPVNIDMARQVVYLQGKLALEMSLLSLHKSTLC